MVKTVPSTIEVTLLENIGGRVVQKKGEIRTKWNVILANLPPPSLFTNDVRILDKCDNLGCSLSRAQRFHADMKPSNRWVIAAHQR